MKNADHTYFSEALDTCLRNELSKELLRLRANFPEIHNEILKEWDINDFLDNIPIYLQKFNLSLIPEAEYPYTCIITDEEVDLMAQDEHIHWSKRMFREGWDYGESMDVELKTHPDLVHFSSIGRARKRYYRELIYTIPIILKKCGYRLYKQADFEIIRSELIEGIAKAIHERYRMMMREMDEHIVADTSCNAHNIFNVYNRQYFASNYEQLPDAIRLSNMDSAYHIATKLMAIGYSLKLELGNSTSSLLTLGDSDIETMAKLEHERWAWEKRLSGFTFGEIRNDALKKHPCLVPYHELPELEKDKDRVQVQFYPSLLHDCNYSCHALSPDQIKNISYLTQHAVLLQRSENMLEKISKTIVEEAIIPNAEMRELVTSNLHFAQKHIRSSVEALYAASQIQQCILPDKLYFRTCLPNSFVLFKPKDVLSGDFYFISKIHNFTILAVADCTGHGPLGAMQSMICSNFLDQAVNDHRLTDPSMIIGFVYSKLLRFLKRQDKAAASDYGMDLGICNINAETRTLYFAGVNRPLFLFRSNEFEILEPQRIKVDDGYQSLTKYVKPSQQANLNAGDTFYLFSDGYADQLGGSENKKYLTSNLKKLLASIQSESMLKQYEILNRTIEGWRGPHLSDEYEQTDDILAVGVRL